ncbi:acyl-CoA thioesterase [Mycobacterium sp. URHB0021]
MQSTQSATYEGSRRDSSTIGRNQLIRRFHVAPADVGTVGYVGGGRLLEWIDDAAHAAAAQWSGCDCVTTYVGNLHLHRPIGVGDFVQLTASVVHTGHTSIHLLVTVDSSGPAGDNGQTAQCPIIFVAIDDIGRPVDVPRWAPVTMLQMQRHHHARLRIPVCKRIERVMAAESHPPTPATVRFIAGSGDADSRGRVHGGRVMRWIDESAYECGADWTSVPTIASYLAGVRFYRPVGVGDVIGVTARIMHTGPRSVHCRIHITADDIGVGEPQVAACAVAVVVSLDARGAARAVPLWKPHSDEDHRLDQSARQLLQLRQFMEPN